MEARDSAKWVIALLTIFPCSALAQSSVSLTTGSSTLLLGAANSQ
jgi:hypothetical protein